MGKNDKKRSKEQAKELEKAAKRAEAESRRGGEQLEAAMPGPASDVGAAAGAPASSDTAQAMKTPKAESKGRVEASTSEGSGHAPAKAHGRPMTVDASLPGSRDELLALHAAARRRRATATYGSAEHRAAIDEIGRIEIRIADVERAMTPPRG